MVSIILGAARVRHRPRRCSVAGARAFSVHSPDLANEAMIRAAERAISAEHLMAGHHAGGDRRGRAGDGPPLPGDARLLRPDPRRLRGGGAAHPRRDRPHPRLRHPRRRGPGQVPARRHARDDPLGRRGPDRRDAPRGRRRPAHRARWSTSTWRSTRGRSRPRSSATSTTATPWCASATRSGRRWAPPRRCGDLPPAGAPGLARRAPRQGAAAPHRGGVRHPGRRARSPGWGHRDVRADARPGRLRRRGRGPVAAWSTAISWRCTPGCCPTWSRPPCGRATRSAPRPPSTP